MNGEISSTNAIAGLTLAGTGTFTLSAANTYQGTTIQSSFSRIVVNHSQVFSSGTLSLQSSNAGIVAGINLTGVNAIANDIIWGGNTFLYDSGANGIEFSGDVNLNGAGRTVNAQISGGATFGGVISNDAGGGVNFSISNGSNVTLTGVNTYSGNTTIQNATAAGAVSVSNIGNAGVAGNLGSGNVINLGNGSQTGRLIYTGGGEATSKAINLNGTVGGGYIEHAGNWASHDRGRIGAAARQRIRVGGF